MSEANSAPASPANFNSAIAQHRASLSADPPAPPAQQAPAAPPVSDEPAEQPAEITEGTEALPESEESETQEQVQDLLAEAFHGKSGREILEAIKSGELPLELLEGLRGKVKINGEERPVSLKEALAGYQRNLDYSRSKWQLQQDRQAHQQEVAEMRGMVAGWKKGKGNMRADFKRLGLLDAFHNEAIAYAQETWQNEQLRKQNPAAYEARMALQKEREERERLEFELSRKPQANNQREVDNFAQQVGDLYPAAFQRHSIKDSALARQRFGANLQQIYSSDVDLAEQIEAAAQATAEELSELAVEYQRQQANAKPANDNGKKPNPSPLPGRPQGAPASGHGGLRVPTSRKPEDFQAYLRKRRGQ